eukprot:CAMPEP_0113526096 /NCGR_PEP_ID=MMETSP0015_2-20120614/552_1 /TAXON_ID=2838 /ORGANISM="Odontella" /LENGTH=36 /DNA_ID=CAMNT_0000424385 /DNA_START=732 /DNA_END=842 /DNA_ORIENTATION=- /assembly_acc=CAM_ASM_000160
MACVEKQCHSPSTTPIGAATATFQPQTALGWPDLFN